MSLTRPNLKLLVGKTGIACCYHPNDELNGIVTWDASDDATIGKVTVSLTGSAKSTIMRCNGQSETKFDHHTKLFDIEQVLHDDHFTRRPGSLSWPFTFRIPNTAEVNALLEQRCCPSVFRESVMLSSQVVLPTTFGFSESKSGNWWHASVEYAIVVSQRQPDGALVSKSIGIKGRQQQVQEFHLHSASMKMPIDYSDPRCRAGYSTSVTIKTYKLLPSAASDSSSLSQRMKSVLQPNTIPRYTFEVDASYPSIVQDGHPQAMPFIVSISVTASSDATTIHPCLETFYRYPSITINAYTLNLVVYTRCHGSLANRTVSESSEHTICLIRRTMIDDVRLAPRSIAWDQKVKRDEEIPSSIDLGTKYGARTQRIVPELWEGSSERNQNDNGKQSDFTKAGYLTPSFDVGNLSRAYGLSWEIELECVGQKATVKGKSPQNVTVIAAANTRCSDRSCSSSSQNETLQQFASDGDYGASLDRGNLIDEELPSYVETPDSSTERRTVRVVEKARD